MSRQTVRLEPLIHQVLEGMDGLMQPYGAFAQHPSQQADPQQVAAVLSELVDRLKVNPPLFHPHYVAQMLKPPHPVAVAAYLATMLINPNNHSIDAGKATTILEREVLESMAAMFDYPNDYLGHLTWSGTTANLEALWVSRELRPGKRIAYSKDAHYTHGRMAEVLNVPVVVIPTEIDGRMSLEALEAEMKKGDLAVVVATLGTTGLGAVDPLADIVALAEKYDVRVHVDAAYGGFFTLVQNELEPETARHYAAIGRSDSIVVDPHKHGLQPYGCGSVFFKDHTVGRFYKHDSPYTYFASKEVHFGEIQLETSRAGASAAALWATLQVLPLTRDGLGAVLQADRRAAVKWHGLLEQSPVLAPYQRPELDILGYLPRTSSEPLAMSEITRVSDYVFSKAMSGPAERQLHLAEYKASSAALAGRGHNVSPDAEFASILRSVTMKPEHETIVDEIHSRVEALTVEALNQ